MAFPCGSTEKPQDRPACGAGCAHQRRSGADQGGSNSGGNYGRNSLYRGNAHRQSGGYAARVAATFGAADFIAAEDTRVTMKLLNYLGLKKPMVSYYEHALQKGEAILQRIEAGESCALCSDAGMPCVSDPGEVIVRDALARGIKVVPVPAASACVTALAVSGQDTSRWVFEGFLPVNRKQKKERLAALLQEKAHRHLLRSATQAAHHAGRSGRRLWRRAQHYPVPGADQAARGYLEDYPRRGGGALQSQRAARGVCAGDGWCAGNCRPGSRS